MTRYAIALRDEDLGPAYWTTRVGDTDNYTTDKNDAALFPDRICAKCLMQVLNMVEDHDIVPVDGKED